jgi:hypothetical protein
LSEWWEDWAVEGVKWRKGEEEERRRDGKGEREKPTKGERAVLP